MSFLTCCCTDSRLESDKGLLKLNDSNILDPKTVRAMCQAEARKFELLKTSHEKANPKPGAKMTSTTGEMLEYVDKTTDTGNRYAGYMVRATQKKSGFGKYTYVNNNSSSDSNKKSKDSPEHFYLGEWSQNKAHGLGYFSDEDGSYVGQWNNGDKSGYGTEKWTEDHTLFEGTYSKGVKSGIGCYVWEDGSTYEGEIKDDEISGKGILKDADGVYTGQFHENAQHGKGKWDYTNGNTYEGEFVQSLREGEGKMYWADRNTTYDGQWRMGVPWGEGYLSKNGSERKQVWYWNGKQLSEYEYKSNKRRNSVGTPNVGDGK